MISIAELQDIATKEKTAEKEAAKAKYVKDLVVYRDKVKQIRSKVMEHLQDIILTAMKRDQNRAGLYRDDFKKLFATVNEYDSGEILCYIFDENRKVLTAYDKVLQEEGKIIRNELMKAGIKEIIKNNGYMGEPYIYIYF